MRRRRLWIKRVDNTLANQITIDGDGSETIDGETTKTLHTQYEAYELMSDGEEWHVLQHFTETGWISFTMTIDAVTTTPTKPSGPDEEKAYWRRLGESMEIMYSYHNADTTGEGGANGSGSYVFMPPDDVTINTTPVPTSTVGAIGVVGSATGRDGTTEYLGVCLTTGSFVGTTDTRRGLGLLLGNDTTAPTSVGSAFINMTGTGKRYSFRATIPITEWSN